MSRGGRVVSPGSAVSLSSDWSAASASAATAERRREKSSAGTGVMEGIVSLGAAPPAIGLPDGLMWPAMHRPLTSGRKHRLRLPAPLRVAVWLLLAVILLPYVLTPLYAVVNPVSTLMIWRRVTGEPVHRTYVPLSR